jgi:phospholipid/cholesterol/gamma-HCH transport system ATP-binding protein
MGSAYKIADRIAMMYGGKIIALGAPDEIKESPDEYVQQFINGSAQGPIDVIGGA